MASDDTYATRRFGALAPNTTYPYGPEWGNVKPYRSSEACKAKDTLPSDMNTTRRVQYPNDFSGSPTLRYPGTYVPPEPTSVRPRPAQQYQGHLHLNVRIGVDGEIVPVTVKSTGTVADVITAAVETLRHRTGSTVSYSNLRVTGLFSESGRPLSSGYRLHSQGQVPFIADGSTLTLKILT